MHRGLAGVVAAALTGTVLIAQQPTFRVQVDAIELDAFVTDAQGNPVRGLTMDDFEILEDGKPQAITSFTQVDIPFDERTDALDAKAPAVEPDVLTNDHTDGRVYLFMLDGVAAEAALRARVFLKGFLRKHFAANDRGAVVFLGHQDPNAAQPFTNNPRLLLAAFDRFMGGFPPGDAPPQAVSDDNPASKGGARLAESFSAAQRSQALIEGLDTMVGLESAIKMMAGLHGRRKALLLVSSGLPEADG